MKPVNLTIHIDGAARGNPGPAAFAYVILQDGQPLTTGAGYLGTATNNIAEYTALVKALEKAAELQASSVLIRSDSELLVKQMRGEYRVRNANLLPLYEQASRLSRQFESVRFSHVAREQNRAADQLCNQVLDEVARTEEKPLTPASSPRKSEESTRDWQIMLAEAEDVLRQAARSWAKVGPEQPPPKQVLQQIMQLLQERGFLRHTKMSPQ